MVLLMHTYMLNKQVLLYVVVHIAAVQICFQITLLLKQPCYFSLQQTTNFSSLSSFIVFLLSKVFLSEVIDMELVM